MSKGVHRDRRSIRGQKGGQAGEDHRGRGRGSKKREETQEQEEQSLMDQILGE